jgi:hypothetical protein
MRNTSFTVIVTTNEPATIAIDDDQVVSGTSATFWVHTNGRYTIRRQTRSGTWPPRATPWTASISSAYHSAGRRYAKVKQGTTVAEFLGILDGEISASRCTRSTAWMVTLRPHTPG